ncbi:acyl-CoA synthetase [Nocardioides fonticola]|uniref:Acyl-CoA synthetase n=1 Tax=Nocardioides fonticola TaxID=450363 RepID=A0ABP7XKD2_9ACTN
MTAALWPRWSRPDDVEEIERIPLAERPLPATTTEILRLAARSRPDAVALHVMPDAARWAQAQPVTYAELAAETARVAHVLVEAGVSPTTPVALLAPNCRELVPALLGAQAAGVVMPLNANLAPDVLARLVAAAGVRHVIAAGPDLDARAWERVADLAAAGLLDAVWLLRPTSPDDRSDPAPEVILPGVRVAWLAEATAGRPIDFADPHGPDDLAAIFHTGGTTGVPKLAAHTHHNQVSDAWMIAADTTLDAQPDATILAALPLFHVNALHVTLLAPLMRGRAVVWAGPLGFRDPALYAEIWRIVEHFRVGSLSAVPTVYAVLAGCAVDADISSLRVAIVGASALPKAVRESFEGHVGVPLLEGYGLTEATCASARGYVEHPRPGSVGKRLPYQRMRVVRDVDGAWRDVEPGGVGTLVISGPTIFPGYVTGRDATEWRLDPLGTIRDGWLDTGDLARIDADGFVHLVGRSKDLIIRGGHNIEPATIEAALLEHPEVVDAAAVGRPDPRAGELPVAYVSLVAGALLTGDELLRWVADAGLEPAAVPKEVTVWPALPLTDVGKPFKLPLRADAAARALAEALGSDVEEKQVVGGIVDGSVVVTVRAPAEVHERIRSITDRYALEVRLEDQA